MKNLSSQYLVFAICIALITCFFSEARGEERKDCSAEAAQYLIEGNKYLADFQIGKAIVSAEKAISSDPSCVEAYIVLGNYYFGIGEYAKAIDAYNNGIKNVPSQSSLLYNLIGVAYYTKKDYNEAINVSMKSLELSSDYEQQTYVVIGNSYHKLGDDKKAKEYLDKALEISIKKGDNLTSQNVKDSLKKLAQ